MKDLMTKTASAVSGVVLFAMGGVLAGLGFAVVSLLALLALAAVGVALLASHFLAMREASATDADETIDATATA